ncbi:MAG: PAS domain S-box protein [Spirochaetota bacterium]
MKGIRNINNQQKTILVVEDEAIIALYATEILKKNGFAVITALSGEEAISKVKNSEKVDLILMDIDLGKKGMDGTEAAQAILREYDIPVVFLSSHTEREIVEKTEKITSYGFVVKNAGITVLLASINMAFKLHAAHQELKKTEEVLRRNEEKYRFLFNSIQDAILVANTDRNIIDCNSAFCSIFGYSKEEILGKKTLYIYDNEAEFQAMGSALKEHRSSEKPFLFSVNYKKKDGTVFPGETGVFFLKDSKDEVIGFIGLIRDITERKQAEERIKQMLAEKEVLLKEIHHPLKNNMMTISGFPPIQAGYI